MLVWESGGLELAALSLSLETSIVDGGRSRAGSWLELGLKLLEGRLELRVTEACVLRAFGSSIREAFGVIDQRKSERIGEAARSGAAVVEDIRVAVRLSPVGKAMSVWFWVGGVMVFGLELKLWLLSAVRKGSRWFASESTLVRLLLLPRRDPVAIVELSAVCDCCLFLLEREREFICDGWEELDEKARRCVNKLALAKGNRRGVSRGRELALGGGRLL